MSNLLNEITKIHLLNCPKCGNKIFNTSETEGYDNYILIKCDNCSNENQDVWVKLWIE